MGEWVLLGSIASSTRPRSLSEAWSWAQSTSSSSENSVRRRLACVVCRYFPILAQLDKRCWVRGSLV
ncbi:hypothetical protein IF1G_00091 [Cordyceps javanica]|uniref:Uncharacterized protein n=1 Tax=Cordyceps javanica TaxID=43265 RepID=A0A545VEU8_9HYPO|nr:hypothetical protein IF1G_00091 [Cordyceps javanica]